MLVIPIQIIICYISLFPISFPLYFPPDRLSNPKMKDDLRRYSSPSPPLHRHEHRLHHHHHHRLHAVNITRTPTSPEPQHHQNHHRRHLLFVVDRSYYLKLGNALNLNGLMGHRVKAGFGSRSDPTCLPLKLSMCLHLSGWFLMI
jgi:hypothetical protein